MFCCKNKLRKAMEVVDICGEQASQNPSEANDIQSATARLLWDKVARPLKIPMIIFGLYHEKGTKTVHPQSEDKDDSLTFAVTRIYHVFVVVFLWYNFARFLVSFWIIGTQDLIYNNISVCAWTFHVAANNSILLKICYKGDVCQLISNQSKLCFCPSQSVDEDSSKYHVKPSWMKYRSFALAGSIVGLCGLCLNIAAMLFIIYGSNESSVSYSMICLPWSSDLACGFSSVFVVYSSAAWILTIVFIAFICNILSGQLAQLTYDFTETFGGVTNFEAKLLDTFRRKFSLLCRSVELADEMLSPLIAVAYCTHIPGIIFLLYQVVSGETEISYTLIASFWIVASSMNLAIISYFAVTVPRKGRQIH